MGLVACCVVGLFVLLVTWTKLGSVDTGYHVAYGRQFLDHGVIVDRDPFLYPENARRFVNGNWGSQVLMALGERAGGAWGLIGLRTILVVVVFGSVGAMVGRSTGSRHWVAWTWAVVAVVVRCRGEAVRAPSPRRCPF